MPKPIPTRSTAVRVVAHLATRAELAEIAGVPVNTIDAWRARHQGQSTRQTYAGNRVDIPFPNPITVLAGAKVWWAPDVLEWMSDTGRSDA